MVSLSVSFFALGLSVGRHISRPEPVEPVRVYADTLSSWQMLQMAIIFTESKGDPNATGKAGDAGIYQITPIFVKEANRIAGTDFIPEDAYNPLKSIHMFSVVQDYRNPEHDENRAIKLHNPGGAAIGYPQKVKQNLEFVKRMEAVRSALKEYELRKSI